MRRIAILGVLVLLAMVAAPAVSAAPDLIVTSVDVNPGNTRDSIVRVYVNGSNDIAAVVHNNGPDDVMGDFDVCFEADGTKINCTTVTGGLTAGTNTTVSIDWTPTCTDYPVMPGFPPQSLPLTINVTADCNCSDCPNCPIDGSCGTIAESDETNNTVSKVIPAIQAYSGTNGVIGGAVNNGYKSKNFDCDNTEEPLGQFRYYELVGGGVEYNVSGVKDSAFAPQENSTRVHHIDLPVDAVVKDARLYVYWYDKWGNYKTYPTGCLADLNVNFDGTDLTPDVVYQDSKAFGYYQSPKGSSVFNVTDYVDDYVLGGSSYTAIVMNMEPIGGNNTTLLGELLVVVYDGACGDEVQIWVLEGTDYLMAADETHNNYNYSVSPEDATATVAFGGSINEPVDTAQLITVVAQGQSSGSDMLFNGNVIKTDAWDAPTEAYLDSKIDIEDVSVKSNLLASGNNMGFRDTGTGGMQASNVILVVKGAHEAAPNSVYFEPEDIRLPKQGDATNVSIWINTSEALGTGFVDFSYTCCCANVTAYYPNDTNWNANNAANLDTCGRVTIGLANTHAAGLGPGLVHIGDFTIECCGNSYCETDLDLSAGDSSLENTSGDPIPVDWNDATFKCNIPDLTVTMVKGNEINETHYNVTCIVRNAGEVNASASSADLTVDGVQIETASVPELGLGEAWTCDFASVIELTGTVDDLLACADCNDEVVELDETNNCMIGRYPGEVVISIQPAVTYVQPQDQFDVKVHIDTKGMDVYAVQYRLTYNTSVVRAETQNKDTFLGSISETMVIVNEIDQPHGEASYAESRKVSGAVNVSDNVTNVHFIAIGVRGATTALTLDDIIISNEDGVAMAYTIEDGAVEITDNTAPVANGTSKHRINNVAQKYQCISTICSCSYDPDYPGKGGNISYIRWAFGDGQYGTSEGLPIENCTCKEHKYESWQWDPLGEPTGNYVPFEVQLDVTDDGCPEITSTTNFSINVYIAGDANGDGEVNVLDAVWVGKYWREECDHGQCDPCYGYLWDGAEEDGADLNNDCEINVLDAVIIGANWRHVAW